MNLERSKQIIFKKRLKTFVFCFFTVFFSVCFLALGNVGTALAVDGIMNGKTITGETDNYLFWLQTYDPTTAPYFFDKLFINKAGNVGINVSDPGAYKLNVNGNTNITGVLSATSFSGLYSGTIGAQNVSSGEFGSNTSGGNFYFGATKPGNVGIGTTNPIYKFTVNGQIFGSGSYTGDSFPNGAGALPGVGFGLSDDSDIGGLLLKNEGSDRKDTVLYWGDSSNDNLRFMFASWDGTKTNLSEKMRIAGTGNVGIGTTNPGSYKLFVNGTANFTGAVTATSFSGPLSGTIGAQNVSSGEFGSNTAGGNFYFAATKPGNVGIGTTNPTAKLDVVGGNIDIDNTTFASQTGVITKNGTRFIHDFNYGNNGTVTTDGANTFVGRNAGNFTMGSTATATYQASYNVGVGVSSILSNTTGFQNSALGGYSLQNNTSGVNNSAFGFDSVYSNTTGSQNSSFGVYSLQGNTVGNNNSALGYYSLGSNVAGLNGVAVGFESQRYANNTSTPWTNQNTSVGYQALRGSATAANNTGNSNTALGYQTLYNNTIGGNNTAVGYGVLYNNTGNSNSALGYGSLSSNTTGSSNSALGQNSLFNNTTGSSNSAFGVNAGRFIADGSTANQTSNNSVYLGYNTRAYANGDTNETVIGYNAVGIGSNSVVLGNDSVAVTALKGNVGIGTTTPGSYKLFVNGSTNINGVLTATSISGPMSGTLNSGNVSSGEFGSNTGGGNYIFGATKPGNVGIGTTNPAGKLEVSSNSGNYVYLTRPSSSYDNTLMFRDSSDLKFWIGMPSWQDGGSAFGIFNDDQGKWVFKMNTSTPDISLTPSGGNVGIGTTNPGAYKLNVNGNILAQGTADNSAPAGDTVKLDGYGLIGNRSALYITNSSASGLIQFGIGGVHNAAPKMTILSSGNVGIGTTNPTAKLDVNGSFASNNGFIRQVVKDYLVPTATYVPIYVTDSSTSLTSQYVYRVTLSTTGTGTASGAVYVVAYDGTNWVSNFVSGAGTSSNHPLMRINGTTLEVYHNHASTYSMRAMVDTYGTGNTNSSLTIFGLEGGMTNLNGNVGISTTNPNTARLVIAPSGSYSIDAGGGRVGNITSVADNDAASVAYVKGVIGGGSGSTVGYWTANGSNIFNSNGGNVGIGTSTATTKLFVNGDITAKSLLATISSRNVSSGTFGDLTGGGNYSFLGNVGIGTTNPSAKLEVNGNIYLSPTNPLGGVSVYNAQKEQYATASVAGAGWYRVAHIDYANGRGQNTVTIYTTGGSNDPRSTTIRWFHNWDTMAAISAISEYGNGIWSQARVTDDGGANSYLEIYFDSAITSFNLSMQYDGGFAQGALYSGTLSAGSGTVRATAPLGLLTVGTNKFFVNNTGNVGIGTTSPVAKLDVVGGANFTGTVTAGSFSGPLSGTINSANVSAGDFGANTGHGTYSFSRSSYATSSNPSGENIFLQGAPYDAAQSVTWSNSPGIGFHWPGRTWGSLVFDGTFNFVNSSFTGYMPLAAGTISATTLNSSGNLNVSGTSNLANNLIFSSQANGVNFGGVSSTATPTYSTSGNMITGGSDYAGLSKLNSVAVQTWFGFSVSPTISGQTVAQGSPAFSINARTGEMWNYGSSYLAANTGSVGIGTTTPGSYKLFVNGTAKFTGTVTAASFSGPLSGTLSAGNISSGEFGANTGGGNYIFGATKSGNVGIGTTNPQTKLHIYGSSDATYGLFEFESSDARNTKGPFFSFKDATGPLGWIGYYSAYNSGKDFVIKNYVTDGGIRFNAGNSGTASMMIDSTGNVGIGTTAPAATLDVNGGTRIAGNLTMTGTANITGVQKITVNTIDPLYNIFGTNYASFAASVVGGVKEEVTGKLNLNQKVGQEYQAIINFKNQAKGSDLWVWRNVVDFNKDNVEAIITPYGSFANTYYYISGDSLVFRSDRPVEISYRLIAKRFDWQKWPTKPLNQTEKAGLIIK